MRECLVLRFVQQKQIVAVGSQLTSGVCQGLANGTDRTKIKPSFANGTFFFPS